MKKLLLPILILILFIPFYVNAETCDTDKITIENISLESKSDNVEEIDETTANGKNINLNLSMSEVGDNIEYKIVVKNDSNEDYELDKNSFNISSDYIKYSFELEDDINIIKANSSKVVYLKVNYVNEVPDNVFESGTYNDNKSMTLSLFNGNTINVSDTLKNPNTGVQSYILISFIILLISITTYLLLKKKKYTKFMILIIGTAIIFPISIYALCKCEIKIESNVKIENNLFTGTLYRYNNVKLRNGSNISGYLLKSSDVYRNFLFNSKEECNANIINDEVCEKVKKSIFNYPGFSMDKESLNKYVFLRHDVVDNIIKNTYICYLDDSGEYCMQGGDNGNSFSLNEQVIRDFNHYNSYCSISVRDGEFGCSGSYGMEMFAHMNGKISAYYIFGMGCDVASDSTSSCWNY